jgi:glycine cleavage system regulatory protein
MVTLVLSIVGSDRPGLTQALANAVLSSGGNWLESHLSRLGGLYVGSVLVELEEGGVDDLRSAVREVDAQGLEVRISPAVASTEPAGETVEFSLVGQDRSGIVHQVTAILSRLDANIESFDTRLSTEAHSGVPLFHMDVRLRLPPPLRPQAVQAALEEISAEVMVDISLAHAE